MSDERRVFEPVRRGDVQTGTLILTHLPTEQSGPVFENSDEIVYRVIDWMPACPPGVDAAKWALVIRQLETVHSVLEEADQTHLKPESVANLMNEAIVTTRKLGVELETVMASLRRAIKKSASTI